MLKKEESELLTRTGPGTPAGAALRRYWQPVALSEELPPGAPPVRVRIMSEDLVLFRDDQGRIGLLGLHCSHRGTDLSCGRIEDGGLRCPYHGWLYDVRGQCLDQPGELPENKFHQRIRHLSYPCREHGDLIFAYLGPGEPPLLPGYSALLSPPEFRFATKYYTECNYLQANEGTMDPVHLSFLHRRLDKTLEDRGTESFRLANQDRTPRIEIEERDFGLRIYSTRKLGEDSIFLRINNFVYPNLTFIAGETEKHGYTIHWHVPIDDENNWRYHVIYSETTPLNKEAFQAARSSKIDDSYRLIRNKRDRYGQDRAAMRTRSFVGMGEIPQVEDNYAVESQGAIQNRAEEHLANSDMGIAGSRRLLQGAIQKVQEGRDPPHVVRDPSMNSFPDLFVLSETLRFDTDVKEHVKQIEIERKKLNDDARDR